MIHMKPDKYIIEKCGDDINWLTLFRFVKDMLLGLKMHGLVYIFKKVMSKSKCVENHFMDNYIFSLKKYDL
mgnify:CR=1 FL=1